MINKELIAEKIGDCMTKMAKITATTMTEGVFDAAIDSVRRVVAARAGKVASTFADHHAVEGVASGKMLRSRLGVRLFVNGAPVADSTLEAVCAATELAHAASLCHDDVIDNSLMRRSMPTLWRTMGTSGAILIGDLLLCEAMDLMMQTDDGRHLASFVGKVRQVIEAEAEQELLWRGKPMDVQTCLRLARGKTGPLFALVSEACGGDDADLCELLSEAGCRIGAAYQLADDLMDVLGSEDVVGKTLGTDSARGKNTLAQVGQAGERIAAENITDLCASAVEMLNDYPKEQKGLREFLRHDLCPVLEQMLGVETGIAI